MKAGQIWRTLRFRFALMTAGLMLAVMAGFGSFVYWHMARGLSASIDEGLRLNASQALAAVEIEQGQIDLPDGFFEAGPMADARARGFVLRLLDPEGAVQRNFGAYPELDVEAESVAAANEGIRRFSTITDAASGDAARVLTVPVRSQGRTVGIYQVGQPLAGMQATLATLRGALLIGTPALALIAGLGGYALAGRALAPIDDITRTARRISTEDLSARLDEPPANDEVGRLARTINEMLERLEDGFRRERRFTQDASHELRTPLAAMQAILDVTGERPRDVEAYQAALSDLSEETARLKAIAERLLRLARNDQRHHAPLDLATLVRDVTESLRPLAESRGLSLDCHVPDELRVAGDADGLISAFANVIENAIKYTETGRVTVRARETDAQTVRVQVIDTGIGIAPPHLPFIFERFYRVDASRANGAGLGLSIAREVVRAHGGAIDAQSEVGAGTVVTITLPVV